MTQIPSLAKMTKDNETAVKLRSGTPMGAYTGDTEEPPSKK